MLPNWLSTWYHQQAQSQEPFHDYYEQAGDEEGDWVEVITPSSMRNSSNTPRRQPTTTTSTIITVQKTSEQYQQETAAVIGHQQPAEVINNNNDTKIDNESSTPASTTTTTHTIPSPTTPTTMPEPVVKGLSRQERRANARFAVKEKRKQSRNAAMVLNRSRIVKNSCLPSSPISIDH